MSNKIELPDLLLCPFCGGETNLIGASNAYFSMCSECGAESAIETTRSAAIAAWNKRADTSAIAADRAKRAPMSDERIREIAAPFHSIYGFDDVGFARALLATAPQVPEWISVDERLPEDETPVLILYRGDTYIGELRWEHPTYEETFNAFRYWDSPTDDGKDWEWYDITHWMPLPSAPQPEQKGQHERPD